MIKISVRNVRETKKCAGQPKIMLMLQLFGGQPHIYSQRSFLSMSFVLTSHTVDELLSILLPIQSSFKLYIASRDNQKLWRTTRNSKVLADNQKWQPGCPWYIYCFLFFCFCFCFFYFIRTHALHVFKKLYVLYVLMDKRIKTSL